MRIKEMGDRLRILVVDDSRATLFVLEQLIRRLDCEIRTCEDSKEAVRVVQEFAPHIVILDIQMPDLDGYMVAEDLSELESPDYLLVALTAYSDEEHRRECAANGFDLFLEKPASLDQIERLVESAKARFLPVG